jgi:hypothetical protein
MNRSASYYTVDVGPNFTSTPEEREARREVRAVLRAHGLDRKRFATHAAASEVIATLPANVRQMARAFETFDTSVAF